MPSDAHFLAEIEARPEDRAVRLVYADWLEEHGEERRAELVRVEEEMRSVPIYSDRYWELKPRRNELRAECDANWLARMRYGTDYEPVFGEVPDGWRERWRLLREFTERWHGILLPDVGGHAGEVRKVEKELKRALPPAMREWVAYVHDLVDQDRYEEVFRDCYRVEDLQDSEGLPAISLMIQGESDIYWAVKKDDLGKPDPPVEEYHLDYDSRQGERWVSAGSCAPHVTDWVFQYVWTYLDLARHGGGEFALRVKPTADLLRQIEGAFPVRSRLAGRRLFETTNLMAALGESADEDGEVYLEVHTRKELRREQVPAFLWELARAANMTGGMFNPKRS